MIKLKKNKCTYGTSFSSYSFWKYSIKGICTCYDEFRDYTITYNYNVNETTYMNPDAVEITKEEFGKRVKEFNKKIKQYK